MIILKILLMISCFCFGGGIVLLIYKFGYDVGFATAKKIYNNGMIIYDRSKP